MEEFQRQIAKGFIIETVNLSQATIEEAVRFKKQLDMDISLGYKNIIIDLTNCSALDSTFFGVLVVTLKQLMLLGGTIKIVKPGMFSKSLLNLTGTIEIFELYDSLNSAIEIISNSLASDTNLSNGFTADGLDPLGAVS